MNTPLHRYYSRPPLLTAMELTALHFSMKQEICFPLLNYQANRLPGYMVKTLVVNVLKYFMNLQLIDVIHVFFELTKRRVKKTLVFNSIVNTSSMTLE